VENKTLKLFYDWFEFDAERVMRFISDFFQLEANWVLLRYSIIVWSNSYMPIFSLGWKQIFTEFIDRLCRFATIVRVKVTLQNSCKRLVLHVPLSISYIHIVWGGYTLYLRYIRAHEVDQLILLLFRVRLGIS